MEEFKMKLVDVYSKPLKEVVDKLELIDLKVHSDDKGDVKSVELKYVPRDIDDKSKNCRATVF
jgi:hypothetical protein